MVFSNPLWNDTGEIIVYSNYHKYWLDKERKIKNPLFDIFSGRILDLKEGKQSAIQYFYNLLDPEICSDVTICVVPSSDSKSKKSGMCLLGEKLAGNGRHNAVYYLNRFKTIDKLANGGNRDISVHLKSINTLDEIDISEEIVLLMDDVTTTGNSLYACREILLEKGAQKVEMFALGKSI
ncbi:MAG: phosphoribosyltransferase [Lachnospiraceae bacterium]|nr:phosphoribosyltransferase [Lachnospiraceae bacterium]